MKTRWFTLLRLVVSAVSLLAILAGGIAATAALAGEAPDPTPSLPDHGRLRAPDGTWYMPAGSTSPRSLAAVSVLGTGGPDEFGYTWDDSVPLDWIDATVGTDTGLSGDGAGHALGPVALPFSFPYYQNAYASLYIAASGYLAFAEDASWPAQPEVPSADAPNNIVVPYGTFIDLASVGPANRVYYTSGGTAPDRYFVAEWYQTASWDAVCTFEVVLHENGDIVFQYQTMTYPANYHYPCGTIGIEDSAGLDGLAYGSYYCSPVPSGTAVRFYRPAPTARVKIEEPDRGRFTHAGEQVTFEVPIRNTGRLGADTYDIEVMSPWLTTLYTADGVTPLSDTDADGLLDTGAVAQWGSTTVVLGVRTPQDAAVGDHNLVSATVRSSLDTSASKVVTLQTAIPARFSQVWSDSADQALSLYLVQPASQVLKTATADWSEGRDMAVAETRSGFACFWSRLRSSGVCEIEYTLLDHQGNTVRGVTKLTDHSTATSRMCDSAPAVAVAPDGRIGVLWERNLPDVFEEWDGDVYFAILNSPGNLLYGPANLTGNVVSGRSQDLSYIVSYDPRIAATGDNRFVLAWQRLSLEGPEASGCSSYWLAQIHYAVRDTNGSEVKAPTLFTSYSYGSFYSPAVTSLGGNQALLAYSGPDGVTWAVLDSAGNTVHAATLVGASGSELDAVELSSGNIALAWRSSDQDIRFAVVGGASNSLVIGPVALHHPVAAGGDAYVSVTADAAGHAILTWTDDDYELRRNLYYALLEGAGHMLTPPLIFRTSQGASSHIWSSFLGHGNTSCHDLMSVFLPLALRH